ncbi:hypothetical protein [Parvularcula sp. LCG005]|uniref:hypothetical protein n=1 Tax=Parvularcula sp. LCG005 TaxID=3078805 RepID=UPI002941CAD8|nr:hypothetical protein [Parvularcula sp. LCG005]WOI54305.1 hypothetical protein RUI03_04715 [Parvularcula sp. LCG005]
MTDQQPQTETAADDKPKGPYAEVQELRTKLGFTAADVGKHMGINPALLTSLEAKGEVPSAEDFKSAIRQLAEKRHAEIFGD